MADEYSEIIEKHRAATKNEPAVPVRLVIVLQRGKDGLFVQPQTVGPEYELQEAHRRQGFAEGYKYADETTGNPRTFDPRGDYDCGHCNKADGERCLFVRPAPIDRVAGSCGYWEDLCAGDPELSNNEKPKPVAVYGVRKGGKPGKVFGCHECPWSSKAYAKDSRGRGSSAVKAASACHGMRVAS